MNDSANHQNRYATTKGPQDTDDAVDAVAVCAWENTSKEPEENYNMLAGRKVLVVNDEVRDLFSLTKVLEGFGLQVRKAINEHKALVLLEKEPDIEIVLMDIARPGTDDCETIRRIRRFKLFENLPIIALTAKIIEGDRAKCLAGVWD